MICRVLLVAAALSVTTTAPLRAAEPPQEPAAARARRHLDRGDRLLRDHKPEAALAEFEGALREDPNPLYNFYIAHALRALGQLDRARAAARLALDAASDPSDRAAIQRLLQDLGAEHPAPTPRPPGPASNVASQPAAIAHGMPAPPATTARLRLALDGGVALPVVSGDWQDTPTLLGVAATAAWIVTLARLETDLGALVTFSPVPYTRIDHSAARETSSLFGFLAQLSGRLPLALDFFVRGALAGGATRWSGGAQNPFTAFGSAFSLWLPTGRAALALEYAPSSRIYLTAGPSFTFTTSSQTLAGLGSLSHVDLLAGVGTRL
jgi:hypothetical protein